MKKKISEARIYDPVGKCPFPKSKPKNQKPKWLRDWNYKTHEPPYFGISDSKLVNEVLGEIYNCYESGDWSAVDELLRFVPRKNLIQFIPDETKWKKFLRKGEKIV